MERTNALRMKRGRAGAMENPQEYYRHCGPMTAVNAHQGELSALPRDVAALCDIILGVLIHRDMADFAYGVTFSDERKNDAHIRPIGDVFARIRELARARCGFGAYFTPDKFEDHWVCEYWNAESARWILVDAQLDAVQRRLFHPDFDPLDVPHDRFIIAGDAWQRCRAGRAEASCFGLSHLAGLSGMWFIAGNMLRDLASLNRVEMLP